MPYQWTPGEAFAEQHTDDGSGHEGNPKALIAFEPDVSDEANQAGVQVISSCVSNESLFDYDDTEMA